MNTSKKIIVKGSKIGTVVVTYPTTEQAENAMEIMQQLNSMRKTIVPCDVMTGKTEKMSDIEKCVASYVK